MQYPVFKIKCFLLQLSLYFDLYYSTLLKAVELRLGEFMNMLWFILTLLSLPQIISSDLLKLPLLVLHVFFGPPTLCQWLSARIFQPLLTQMNNCGRLLHGSPLHFLIHLHDSIYFPFFPCRSCI